MQEICGKYEGKMKKIYSLYSHISYGIGEKFPST